MRATLAIVRSVVRDTRRNRTALFFTLLIPIFFMVIFGLAFGSNPKLHIGIADQDGTAGSISFVAQVKQISALAVTTGSQSTLLDDLHNDSLDAVAVLPGGFGNAISGGSPVAVQVYENQNSPQSAPLAVSALNQVIAGYDQHLTGQPPRITLTTTSVSTNDVGTLDFLLPSLIAYIVLPAGIQLVAMGLADMRERRVLRRFLATPLRPAQVVGGQLLGRSVTVLLEVVVLILVGVDVFHVHTYGSWALAWLAIIIGTVAFVSIGFLITSFVRTSDGARGASAVVTFPMMFLSGVFIPVDQFPAGLQTAVHVLPLTFLADALHQVLNDGAGFSAIALDLLVLAGWAVASLAIAVRIFRWE
ncbi:MAG: ABC transporter permease [Candidatus Dormibacteraeota bacterium]|nr:ABC transporter permease [Candidatus Dormibacteraeota bacterium]